MTVAQVAHAAGAYAKHPKGTFVVVLAAQDEDHLRTLCSSLESVGIEHTPIVESDTPWDGQWMAIGLPLLRDRRSVRKVFRSLPLHGKGALAS